MKNDPYLTKIETIKFDFILLFLYIDETVYYLVDYSTVKKSQNWENDIIMRNEEQIRRNNENILRIFSKNILLNSENIKGLNESTRLDIENKRYKYEINS